MSKPRRSTVSVVYKPNADEVFQIIVTAGNAYPDALDEAGAEGVKRMHDLIADTRKQYGETATFERPDEADIPERG